MSPCLLGQHSRSVAAIHLFTVSWVSGCFYIYNFCIGYVTSARFYSSMLPAPLSPFLPLSLSRSLPPSLPSSLCLHWVAAPAIWWQVVQTVQVVRMSKLMNLPKTWQCTTRAPTVRHGAKTVGMWPTQWNFNPMGHTELFCCLPTPDSESMRPGGKQTAKKGS